MKNTTPVLNKIDHFYENLITNIQGGVIICQFDPLNGVSKAIYLSEGWTNLTGYTLEDLNENFGGNPQALIYEEDAKTTGHNYMEQTNKGNSYQLEYRFRHKDGRLIWAVDQGVITSSTDGYNQNQSILTDITRIKESEERIRISETRFRVATKASHAAVFEFHIPENRYLYIENAEEIFLVDEQTIFASMENDRTSGSEDQEDNAGKGPETYKIRNVLQAWYHPEDVHLTLRVYEETLQKGMGECEVRVRRPDGGYIWCSLHQVAMYDDLGSPVRVIGHLTNIDGEHKQTERLKQEAQQDALTRLLNKNAIRDMVEQALLRLPCHTYTLLMLDIDNFKGVNDSLGHLFGDAVLMDVSAKLKRLFLRDGSAARIGGDEFAVFLQNELTISEAAGHAEEICAAFRHTYAGEKADYKISCSVGVAFSVPGDTYETLFRRADTALYEAKARGKDQYVIFTGEMNGEEARIQCDIHQSDDSDSGKLKIKERIFELLYNSVDFSSSVNMILSLLGQILEVSRVYILENSADNVYTSCIYEWCAEGVEPYRTERRISLLELDYALQFDDAGIFRCQNILTSHLSPVLKEEYKKRGIKSTFQVALAGDGRIQGFMGYDSINYPVSRASEQVDLMIFAAKVTGTFILKKRADEKVMLYNRNKMEALDQLPCALYVIDDNYCLQYMNDLVLSIFPQTRIEDRCYQAFMKRETPCEECPAAKCQDGPCCREIYNPIADINVIANASLIHWSGRSGMRLICCQIMGWNGD